MHRFIIHSEIKAGTLEIAEDALQKQIVSVLRLKKGERIMLGDGKGMEAEAVIVSTKPILTLDVSIPCLMSKSARNITLYCAILKKENFEWVVQKATEVGADEIVPLYTSRTVKQGLKIERLRAIAREAGEQSGRAYIPQVREPISFDAALAESLAGGMSIIARKNGTTLTTLASQIKKATSLGLFIGPEGGWDAYEEDAAKVKGALALSLGNYTLRAETAAVVATYLVASL